MMISSSKQMVSWLKFQQRTSWTASEVKSKKSSRIMKKITKRRWWRPTKLREKNTKRSSSTSLSTSRPSLSVNSVPSTLSKQNTTATFTPSNLSIRTKFPSNPSKSTSSKKKLSSEKSISLSSSIMPDHSRTNVTSIS